MHSEQSINSEAVIAVIWDHFSTEMERQGRRALKRKFDAKRWYKSYMTPDPQIEAWAQSIETHDAEVSKQISDIEKQQAEQYHHFYQILYVELERESETIKLEIAELLSANDGVDIIHQHFVNTMHNIGKSPLSCVYDQTTWYVSHMRK